MKEKGPYCAIPSITEQPDKSLRKLFDCSLKDSIQKASKEIESWFSKVDNQVSQGSLRER